MIKLLDRMMVNCRFQVEEVLFGSLAAGQETTIVVPGPVALNATQKGVTTRNTVTKDEEYILFLKKGQQDWRIADPFAGLYLRNERMLRELRRRISAGIEV